MCTCVRASVRIHVRPFAIVKRVYSLLEDLEPYYYRDAGSAITLSFVVHGSNSTTWRYQWHRESGVFDSSSVVHSGETTPTLTISRVSGQEKYWCVASNPDKGLTLESSRASVIAGKICKYSGGNWGAR